MARKNVKLSNWRLLGLLLLGVMVFGNTVLNFQAKILGDNDSDEHGNKWGRFSTDSTATTTNDSGATIQSASTPTPTAEATAEPTSTPTAAPTAEPTAASTETTTQEAGPVTEETTVLCVGPDGQAFETDYEDCLELSAAWSQPVQYTVTVQAPATTTTTRTGTATTTTQPTTRRITRTAVKPTPTPSDFAANPADIFRLRSSRGEAALAVEEGKLRVWSRDGAKRVNLTSTGTLTQLAYVEGELETTAIKNNGEAVSLARDTLPKVSTRLKSSGVKLASVSGELLAVEHTRVGAVTDEPLAIDLSGGTMYLTTAENDIREVYVLPDEAVAILQDLSPVQKLGTDSQTRRVSNSGQLNVKDVISLTVEDGIAVYQITALSEKKLFGALPIDVSTIFAISAEDGTLVSVRRPWLMGILNSLSS